MTISISDKPEMNVVNVGDELTEDMIDAINNAASPSSTNPMLTESAGRSAFLEKDGGGTVVGTVIVDSDGTVGGDTTNVSGGSLAASKFGIGTITVDPIFGVSFPDGTSQGTAAVSTPTASDTVAGKVELANDNEIRAGQSTTTTPTTQGSSLVYQYGHLKRKAFDFVTNPSTQVTGAGYAYAQLPAYQNVVGAAGVAGFARAYSVLFHPSPQFRTYLTFFNGKWGFGQGMYLVNSTATTGFTLVSRIGITNAPTAGVALPADDTTTKHFGWKYVVGSSVKLQVFDGTTYQETDTGYTPTVTAFLQPVYIVCWSDGVGTAYIEITKPDGSIVTASRTGCPTGSATSATSQSWVLQVAGTGTQTSAWNLSPTPPVFSADW